jgi:creatinine amidohydrolase
MSEKVHYTELTPKAFRARIAAAPIAYLPLGVIEWHGEHMPLGADALQPQGFFPLLARDVGGIVFPPLHVGPDRMRSEPDGSELYGMDILGANYSEHKRYPEGQRDGSCYWIPDELYDQLLEAIMKQIARAGFRIVLAVGHGPSTGRYSKSIEAFREKFGLDCYCVWGDDEWKTDIQFQTGHGGRIETSIVMACWPGLVQMELLGDDPEQYPVAISDDPRGTASAEHGWKIIEHHRKRLGKVLREALAKL